MLRRANLPWVVAVLLLAAGAYQANSEGLPDPGAMHQHMMPGAKPEAAAQVERAVVVLMPVAQSGVSGTLYFVTKGDALEISGKITGLKPGQHAMHVHQYGDLTSTKDGSSAGGHFNPALMPHGAPAAKERHAGDFGNITADKDGVAVIRQTDPVAKLSGPHSILGRSLVVHADPDQFTQPVGNAGARVAFGVIGVAKPAE
ncbi:MAG: superoxide dismutase family protein [Pirellulales bacterium]